MLAVLVAALPFVIDAATSIRSTYYASAEEESAAMDEYTAAISQKLDELYPDGDFPTGLDYTGGVVRTPDGIELARVPEGTTLIYSLGDSSDPCGSAEYGVSLIGPDFQGDEFEDGSYIEWSVTEFDAWGSGDIVQVVCD